MKEASNFLFVCLFQRKFDSCEPCFLKIVWLNEWMYKHGHSSCYLPKKFHWKLRTLPNFVLVPKKVTSSYLNHSIRFKVQRNLTQRSQWSKVKMPWNSKQKVNYQIFFGKIQNPGSIKITDIIFFTSSESFKLIATFGMAQNSDICI